MTEQEKTTECCALCGRELAEPHSLHHLLPKSQGGKHEHTVPLHQICHSKIHSVFTEKELARRYFTIEALQAHEEMAKFIQWLQNKPPNYHDRNTRHSRKR